MGSTITLHNLAKTYSNGQRAVHQLSLTVQDGEFLVLLGPSGCGKSTLLRMIAGLETISGCELHLGGRIANDLQPSERDIAMIFQSFALYPNTTTACNGACGDWWPGRSLAWLWVGTLLMSTSSGRPGP